MLNEKNHMSRSRYFTGLIHTRLAGWHSQVRPGGTFSRTKLNCSARAAASCSQRPEKSSRSRRMGGLVGVRELKWNQWNSTVRYQVQHAVLFACIWTSYSCCKCCLFSPYPTTEPLTSVLVLVLGCCNLGRRRLDHQKGVYLLSLASPISIVVIHCLLRFPHQIRTVEAPQ